MAPPRKILDERQIEELASINCTVAEIAAVMGVDKRTLERRYAAVIQKGRECGKESLKRMMWGKVKEGNVVMMIWLSKQMLGYTDKHESYNKVETKEKVVHVTEWGSSTDTSPEAVQPTQEAARLS